VVMKKNNMGRGWAGDGARFDRPMATVRKLAALYILADVSLPTSGLSMKYAELLPGCP
jgi:hypothetical protein